MKKNSVSFKKNQAAIIGMPFFDLNACHNECLFKLMRWPLPTAEFQELEKESLIDKLV